MCAAESFTQCAFLFAVPFAALALDYDALFVAISKTVALPRVRDTESWYPVAFDDLPTTGSYRIYKTLVLRIAFLLRCIKSVFNHRTAETQAAQREHFLHMEHQLYSWLDAHMMLMIGIDQLGHIPSDNSPAMQVLIERYSPEVNMAMTESQLPDLSAEVARCSFFTPTSDALRDDPLIYTFSKALPHRCEVREVAVKVSEVAAHNGGYFGFIKLALVAMFLGLYSRCNYRAGWRLRFSVYRLFFFSMDPRLLPFRTAQRTFDAAAAAGRPLGGSAAAMAHDYNLNGICDSIMAPMSPTKRRRAEAANTRLQYVSYSAVVASKYASSAEGAQKRRQSGAAAASSTAAFSKKKKSATQIRQDSTRHWRHGYTPTAAGDCTAALLSEAAASSAASEQVDCDVEMFRQGLFAANSMTRLTYEKNCGVDYYEQRLAAGTLPESGITLRDGSTPPPPPPADSNETIAYKQAIKGMLPCDRELPSEEALQRDRIIYHWISTLVLRDKTSAGESKGEDRDYIFQNAINLAVREYLIFALARWLEPLRQELFARVSWASWEESVMIFGDGLRQKLDKLYVVPCPLGAFLTNYAPYQWMSNLARSRPINNHYTSEHESFLCALKRLMKAKINNSGFGDAPVDRVVPRETEILIQHLLQHWRYPRVAPPINFGAVRRVSAAADASETSTNGVFERYQEKIVAPQLVYMIEPAPLPVALPADGDIAGFIRREYVERARFPLGVFHASDEMLRRFTACRSAYHMAPSDPVVKDFVNWLADHSAYQFYLLRTYCKVVERYTEIHTFALPRHIAEYQLRTLRSQFCVPDNRPVPPHLMRSLVCPGCKRCASVFTSAAAQKNSSMAVGNDEVRFVSRTDDDEVFERVRARGNLPLPLHALQPAASWTEVLQHRAQPNCEVYDRYCGPQESAETARAIIDNPEQFGYMPIDPTSAQLDEFGARLFADTFSERERFAQPTDRRLQIYTDEKPDPSLLQMKAVARGQGRLGELDFDLALWKEVDRRMRIFNGTGADGARSFLLFGHALEGGDGDYASIKWTDTTNRIKAEGKKTKQSNAQLTRHNMTVDQDERAKKLSAFSAKRRRDAESLARFVLCSRRRMMEIDLCGRALRATSLHVSGRVQTERDECILACCDCLARIWSHKSRLIADRIVCEPCYIGARHNGGLAAQRAIRGESTKIVTATTTAPQTSDNALRTRTTALQTQLSPSFTTLCSEVVPNGTPCIMDRCKAFKSDVQAMYGLEVLLDTNVGNETYAFVYFCQRHAKTYHRLFRLAIKLPLSTLKLFMMQNRRDFAEVVTRGSYLDDVMRRAAHATGIGTQARAEEELKRRRKREAQVQRRQRQIASNESTRQRDAATSAVIGEPLPRKRQLKAAVSGAAPPRKRNVKVLPARLDE